MPVTLGNQNITSSTGNLGIGTDSPLARLHVESAEGSGGRVLFGGTTTSAYNTNINVTDNGMELWAQSNARGITFSTGITQTERLRIDSAGRVTMPFQPAFNAKLISSAGGNTAAVANQDLPYSSVRLNTGGNYNGSTYRFTAPVSGNHFFALSISFFANGTAGRRSAGFYVNGNLYEYVDFTTTSNYDIVELATVIPLSVNDFVSVRFISVSSGDQYWGGGAPVGAFKGYLIG